MDQHEPNSQTEQEVHEGRKTARKSGPSTRKRGARAHPEHLFDRELSWLDFNARVLEEAQNHEHPMLERLKFLSIFSNNLDEFFMIHIPGIRERVVEETGRPPTYRDMNGRMAAICQKLQPMLTTQYQTLAEIMERLKEHGIRIYTQDELTTAQKARAAEYFEREVFPVLTPLALGPGHPFPYISNLSLSLAIIIHDPQTGTEHFARVKVPTRPVLPRLVPIPGDRYGFMLLEDLISAHAGRLFPGLEVKACYPFRVTRNADLELQEDPTTDLLELIEEELSKRRFGEVERLEITSAMPEEVMNTLVAELRQVSHDEIYVLDGPLNLTDFFTLSDIDVPELRFAPFVPTVPAILRSAPDFFAVIRSRDVMLHHPYQSFGCVIDFLRQAADDPQVLTIKHTLYRTSGDSPILQALIDAADNGKQVACLVELKARFDEENNITWARMLEKAGVHVVYGLVGLKTHSKVTLVVRREHDGLRRYLHIGTGNYNPKTATVYTDIGILTCQPDFGADATDLFNFLTGYSHQHEFRKFLVAPVSLRRRLEQLVDRETASHTDASPGRIIAKMNALVDPVLIRKLYNASQRGVQIDLLIRGMCCLRPGIPGLSENIRVVSIVGRFLEHSRIFHFHNGGQDEVYIGSADWMPRNLDRRVEVVVPVESAELRRILIKDVLERLLEDNCQSWDLKSDGEYVRRHPEPGQRRINTQMRLLEQLSDQDLSDI